MDTEHIKRVKKHLHILDSSREDIVERWINDYNVVNILNSHEIDINFFSASYAHKVLGYYIDVIKGEQKIGNCPIITRLLEYFHDKAISSSELYMICIHFRESLVEEFFSRGIIELKLYKSIAFIFNANLQGVLEYYSKTIKCAVEEKEYFIQISNTDYLTKTNNRQYFDKHFKQELHRSKRYNNKLSLILLDIDYFKKINDNYGHNVGDEILIELATLIKQNLRTEDTFARWGGEEFIILLPQTALSNSVKKANSLCNIIASHQFLDLNNLTCSFGVTDLKNDDTIETIFKRVDELLYQAKENGRNRVEYI